MISDQVNKKELINWIEQLSDPAMLQTIRTLKEDSESSRDFWNDLPDYVKESIKRAKSDLDSGKGISHDEVMQLAKKSFKNN